MSILQRISKLISANINHLLDEAEDPEVMVKQLIRDMEESIIELRRETIKAIGQQKHLEKQIQAAQSQGSEMESKAGLALESGDETLARQLLAKKLDLQASATSLEQELVNAARASEVMKSNLAKLEDQVQIARQKKEELIRRKRSAEAQLRSQEALQKSHEALYAISGAAGDIDAHTSAIESYKQKILEMEAEAEASEELLALNAEKKNKEIALDKYIKSKAVEDELAKLKKKLQEK